MISRLSQQTAAVPNGGVGIINTASQAQAVWGSTPLRERLRLVKGVRHLIAGRALELAKIAAKVNGRPSAEAIAAQVLPLADACRFLEKSASSLLAPRRLGRNGRPVWLFGVESTVYREPVGI